MLAKKFRRRAQSGEDLHAETSSNSQLSIFKSLAHYHLSLARPKPVSARFKPEEIAGSQISMT